LNFSLSDRRKISRLRMLAERREGEIKMTREETNVGGKMLFLLYHNWGKGLEPRL